MKIKLIIPVVLLLVLTGCSSSVSFEADALIRPPAVQGDGLELQEALEEQLGTSFVLRFPRSGDHRSAIVRHDVDLDGVEEALVFYRPSNELSGTSLAVLDLDEDKNWIISYSTASGMYVDRVIFGDIDGDARDEIIIGWTTYTGMSSLYIYDHTRGELSAVQISETEDGFSYDEVVCGDFDSDGRDEIVIAQLERRNSRAQAIMLEHVSTAGGTTVAPVVAVALDPGTVSFSGSAAGRLSGSEFAMVLYCEKQNGGSLYELVRFDKSTAELTSLTLHGDNRLSVPGALDVDGDGLLELACQAGANEEGSLYIARWYSASGEPAVEHYSVECPYDGLRLILPDGWQDTVQFSRTETGIIICSLEESGTVFELGLFSHDRWGDVLNSARNAGHELTILAEDESTVLAVSLGPAAAQMQVSPDTVADMLRTA